MWRKRVPYGFLEIDFKRIKNLRTTGKTWPQIIEILGLEDYTPQQLKIIYNRRQENRGGRSKEMPWPRPTQCPLVGPWRNYRTHEWDAP